MKEIRIEEKCPHCKGTGVYSGMGESKNCGVICHKCKGSGCLLFIHKYEDFEKREVHPEIKHIYETNPGIKVGDGGGFSFEDFGGMPYSDWLKGESFKRGMENRKFTCPAWWNQSCGSKKPDWCYKDYNFCFGSFSSCPQFKNKESCWKRYDKESEGI